MAPRRIVMAMIEPTLPFGNAAARWYYVLLKGLVERGHEVTAFAACSKAREIGEARALFPAPDYDLRLYPIPEGGGLASKWRTLRRPYSYMFSPELRRDLDAELAQGYDFIPDDRRSRAPRLCLVGNMGWYPGYSAAVRLLTRLWPEIRRRAPEATLQIIGWSARSALAEFLETPGVEVFENVPDVRPY